MDFYAGIENFNRIRSNIIFELVNLKLNAASLADCVYDEVYDLAKVYIILTFDKDDLPAVTRISKAVLSSWQIEMSDLRAVASLNTERLLPSRIELLSGMFKRNSDIDIYICSNPRQYLGASVMLYESRPLQTFAKNKKMNLLIIPCSIHELLVVEAKDYIGIEKLRDVMREFNEKTNKRSEVLSSNIYRYMQKNRDIEMMASYESMFRTYSV
ncbi:MAG: hypothetical protein J6P45_02830 [Lachnospiraceae bacterium]|nr:hypothetical protein [Lachnospiraceae bacterium]